MAEQNEIQLFDGKQVFRLIQSVPSKKAEPFNDAEEVKD